MLILKNCRFVPFLTEGTDLTQGDVLLDGHTIARIAPPDTDFGADAPVLNLKGKTLLPASLTCMYTCVCMTMPTLSAAPVPSSLPVTGPSTP